jgi:nucleotide-binding universal stress UspA family protein
MGEAMFDQILVPLDGSYLGEFVLPHVVETAHAYDAKVILLRVLDKKQATEKAQLFDLVNWQINKTKAKLYLDKIGARFQESGLRIETAVLEGLVAESIIEYALERRVKLIILSSHGRSGLSQWGASSVTQKIILSAPSSILLIRANQPAATRLVGQQYSHILIPLDGSRRAENVLPMIIPLARLNLSQIHMVQVVKKPEMARQMPFSPEDKQLSDRIVKSNQDEATRYLEQMRLFSQLKGIDLKIHIIVSENAEAALHGIVDQENINLVVLSAHGYSGNNQWPYGSMVNNFIQFGKVPLLIVQDLQVNEGPARMEQVMREPSEH